MQNSKTTSHLKLPFRFDEEALQQDLKTISDQQWLPQIYKMNYEGEWTSIALLSKGGSDDNFAFASAEGGVAETAILKDCPYFKAVISQFKCPLISVRLLKLHAQSEIKPHRDYKLGYEDDNFRIHIPIVTNDRVAFILDGEQLPMLAGECWYTNVNFTHSVANRGTEDRVHLVLDGERNEWSDQLFFSLAPKESFHLNDDTHSPETTKKIIQELTRMKVPVAQDLIEKLNEE